MSRDFTIKGQGTNSQGNHWEARDFGPSAQDQNAFYYRNIDGSYYYKNPNGSSYYNNGKGDSQYTSPSGEKRFTHAPAPTPAFESAPEAATAPAPEPVQEPAFEVGPEQK